MTARKDAGDDKDRRKHLKKAVRSHERANHLVPGTAWCRGDVPEGGQSWEGRARMAAAREAAGVPVDEVDAQALARAEIEAEAVS